MISGKRAVTDRGYPTVYKSTPDITVGGVIGDRCVCEDVRRVGRESGDDEAAGVTICEDGILDRQSLHIGVDRSRSSVACEGGLWRTVRAPALTKVAPPRPELLTPTPFPSRSVTPRRSRVRRWRHR